MFDPSVFWPAFKDAGMLRLATVKSGGTHDVYVRYAEPDVEVLMAAGRSKDYLIEYQAADLPKLAEGDALTVWSDPAKTAGVKFRVREAPFVPEDRGPLGTDGYFRRALLTKL